MNWKKTAVVLLVVILVVIGLPMLMPGMGGATCSDCGPAISARSVCDVAAILASFFLVVAVASQSVRLRRDELRQLLRVILLDRPPQSA